ncbi:MAG: YigZ family protein [Micrococcales bacterium]|nr:YigZ family protein [Micrococcales bacterium]
MALVFLTRAVSCELVIKRSRFVAQLFPATSEAQARGHINQASKTHHAARHHCSAWVLGPTGQLQRSNDAGEPAGTAGLPMLEVLRRRQVTDLVAVVSRYFGGTLLGAKGLVRAYSGAVTGALDQAQLERKALLDIVHLIVDPAQAGRQEARLRSLVAATSGAALLSVEHGGTSRFELALDQAGRDALDQALASGRIQARLNEAGQRLIRLS